MKVVINSEGIPVFDWKYYSSYVTSKTSERHYKCQNTGAFKCVETKGNCYFGEAKVKNITYSLPNSIEYDIKTENELFDKLI